MTRLGVVTNVEIDRENARVYVDVTLSPRNTKQGILYRQPAGKIWVIPESGDVVLVDEISHNEYVASASEGTGDATIPADVTEGDIYIGAPGEAISVADETHTHSVTLSDGSTTTTGPPDSTTDTQIQ